MAQFATLRALIATVGVLTVVLSAASLAAADDESPVYRERRFGPYVEPEPRNCAPTLAQAIETGLLPPWGWGWYGYGYSGFPGWSYPGRGWYGGWDWNGGWGGWPGRYPYPYGYNGHYWYPNGPTWPYGSLSPLLGPSQYGPLPPLNYSFYPVLCPWAPGPWFGGPWDEPGLYYW